MRQFFTAIALLAPSVAMAADPPYIHGAFGLQPADWSEGPLNPVQQKSLDECLAAANEAAHQDPEVAEMMGALYGKGFAMGDQFGAVLVGCLADERDGRGWAVLRKEGDQWRRVTARAAARELMALDPAK